MEYRRCFFMQNRLPGLDLLRCIALLFVILFHSFLNNGYYSQAQTGFRMWLAGSVRWLSVSCIGLFLMLTGYLKSSKTGVSECLRGLIPVMFGYLIAAIVSIPVRHFFLGDRRSLGNWIWSIFDFTAVYYGWYVEMYTGLVLLMPYINRLLAQFRETKTLLGLLCTMLLLTALPGATALTIVPDHWRMLYPVTYYLLGAAVRRYQPHVPWWICLLTAASVAAMLGGATVLSTDGNLNSAAVWEFADIWIVLMVVCIFTGLYRIRIRPVAGCVLRWAASGCYGGYLLSHLLDAWCYRLAEGWREPAQYAKLFLCVTLPIYAVSLLGGAVLNWLTERTIGKGTWLCRN